MKFGRETRRGGCFSSPAVAGSRRSPGRERRPRVAADVEVVLDAALGREPVVVPPHRVEDVLSAHAPEARDDVGVRVAEDVADVQRARDGRRRRVDDEGLVARPGRVVGIDAEAVPTLVQPGLDLRGFEVLGELFGIDDGDRRGHSGGDSRGHRRWEIASAYASTPRRMQMRRRTTLEVGYTDAR